MRRPKYWPLDFYCDTNCQMGQSMEKSPKAKDIKIEAISYLMRDYMK